jgi:hypothetical protein
MYVILTFKYNSVEYWALDTILQQYRFSQKFRNIINNICKNSKYNVILPYRLSKDIYISREVKQECSLFLTLFIIFLEPLMLTLE